MTLDLGVRRGSRDLYRFFYRNVSFIRVMRCAGSSFLLETFLCCASPLSTGRWLSCASFQNKRGRPVRNKRARAGVYLGVRKRVGIIGGGGGGLAAALRLRQAGCQVILFEKNEQVGGKMSRLCHEGFHFDLGPTVLTMPFVLRDLCEHVGVSLEERLQLRPVEPTCRYHWSDGTTFDAYSDPERLRGELDRVFPQERVAVETFLRDAAALYEATADVFLFQRFDGFREFFKRRNLRLLPALPRMGVSRTVERSLRARFRSEKLVQLFARFATYNGSSPYRAPATLNVIPHVELSFGAWYPRGGMCAVAETLRDLAASRGVEIRAGTQVEAVRRSRSRIDALVAGGSEHPVDAAVSNADVLWTYRHLLAPAGVAIPAAVARAERSCSGYLMLAAVRGRHPGLAHHNIFFSDDYPGEFRDIFERGRLPRPMTVYVSISARSDPDLAPPGCENWYVLVNAPASGREHGDPAAQQAYAESIWERLRAFGLAPRVEWQSRLTPRDIERRDNSPGGAIYGASSNSAFSAFLRPTNKAPRLENFYFAGGSTHPGGGVPLVLLSGKIAAEMILEGMRPRP